MASSNTAVMQTDIFGDVRIINKLPSTRCGRRLSWLTFVRLSLAETRHRSSAMILAAYIRTWHGLYYTERCWCWWWWQCITNDSGSLTGLYWSRCIDTASSWAVTWWPSSLIGPFHIPASHGGVLFLNVNHSSNFPMFFLCSSEHSLTPRPLHEHIPPTCVASPLLYPPSLLLWLILCISG